MFARWHRVRDGTLTHRQFWREMRPLRRRVERHLRRGATLPDAQTAANNHKAAVALHYMHYKCITTSPASTRRSG
jgi:hypothetical protein